MHINSHEGFEIDFKKSPGIPKVKNLDKIPYNGDKNPESKKIPNPGDKNHVTQKIPDPGDLPKIPGFSENPEKIPILRKSW